MNSSLGHKASKQTPQTKQSDRSSGFTSDRVSNNADAIAQVIEVREVREIHDFHGGIHPPENKRQSTAAPIRDLPLPDQLILPLSQHIGVPAQAIVEVGEQVLKGQLIAEAFGPVSAAVHAPTSGVVTDINEYLIPHSSGMSALCIVIKPDGEERWISHSGCNDFRDELPQTLLKRIRDAGIAGMGGAGFPSAIKLHPQQKIDTLIINAAECEPYITADDMLMREHAEEIITGIQILAHILGEPASVLIGIEDNKPEAWDALSAQLHNSNVHTNIELIEIPTKYPSGGEKQLIEILTGTQVPSGKLPAELGIVCLNVGTAFAIKQAVCEGIPLISRITTVTGKACAQAGNYRVLIGTPVSHVLSETGVDEAQCSRLVMGGPMMGFTLPDTAVPLIKTTNCILAPDQSELPTNDFAQACIRCGLCAEACPASLLPQQLYWYARSQNHERLEAHNLFDCIECGACSYVCPSNIPLVQYYRASKGEIRQHEKDKIVADRARQRFETHQQRIEKEAQEKIARREARRAAALAKQNASTENVSGSTLESSSENSSGNASENSSDNLNTNESDTNSGQSDLVKAAMARLQSTQTSPEQQRQKLERALSAAQSKLQRYEAQLANADSTDDPRTADQNNTLLAKIEGARLQYQDINTRLDALPAQQGPSEGDV
ncbi:MAG: electron transport complex subunit RsxC [Porticoccaceae bacterium]|nr:electron transport complex subunit RsxC [Porticoccaceae bacterium]